MVFVEKTALFNPLSDRSLNLGWGVKWVPQRGLESKDAETLSPRPPSPWQSVHVGGSLLICYTKNPMFRKILLLNKNNWIRIKIKGFGDFFILLISGTKPSAVVHVHNWVQFFNTYIPVYRHNRTFRGDVLDTSGEMSGDESSSAQEPSRVYQADSGI